MAGGAGVAPCPAVGRGSASLLAGGACFEGLQASVQAALVARGLVLVDESLVGGAVDQRDGRLVGSFGSFYVAGIEGVDGALDVGAKARAQRNVMSPADDGLTGALASLS